MNLLRTKLDSGESIFAQLVFAAQKAIVLRQYDPGQPFPSVRTLASELHIHPKTAHKVVQHLIAESWLEAKPGIGTVVADPPVGRQRHRKRLMEQDLEKVILEAKRLGVSFQELVQALSTQWNAFDRQSGEKESA